MPLSLLNFGARRPRDKSAAFDTWLHMNANFAECLFSSEVSFQTSVRVSAAVEWRECNLRICRDRESARGNSTLCVPPRVTGDELSRT